MKYDIEYYEHLLRIHAATAEQINKIRWDFIKEFPVKDLLDFGCGCGFFRAWRPKGVQVDTYDIGKFAQTGKTKRRYDMITMWDVLEHVPDLDDTLSGLTKMTKYLALAIPIKPEGVDLTTWKHYKPGEHLHQFTEESLNNLLKYYGFIQAKKGQVECPPRRDIWDFVYKKIDL